MELQNFNGNSSHTMSSREIADLTGKRHDHVLRDINTLNEYYVKMGLPKVGESSYHNEQGREFREMQLSKIQTMDLMTGYSLELRIKVNRRWEQLEKKSVIDFSNPDTVLMLVQNWKGEKERADTLQIEVSDLKPKAVIAEALEVSTECVLVRDVAYQLKKNGINIGEGRLYNVLRQNNFIHQRGTKPTQKALELNIFDVQERMVQKGASLEPTFTTKVTGKGQIYILNKFISGQWKTI